MEDNSKVSDIKNRIREFARAKKITQKNLCKLLGVSYAYIGSITNSISVDKAEIFRREFPELNIEWLLFGVGEMLRPDNSIPLTNNNVEEKMNESETVICLRETVRNLSETIKSQNEIIVKLLSKDSCR